MKTIKVLLFSLLAVSLLTFSRCKKDPLTPAEQLPPETQTGANTFGCLVDGQVFIPGGAQLSGGSLSCNYQYLGNGVNGGYYFRLAAIKRNNSNGENKSIGIFTDSLEIENGLEYELGMPRVKEAAYAFYGYSKASPPIIDDYETNNVHTGRLLITKLDIINQIVSGTFWFDAINTNGQKVEIRQGRFDVRFTR